MNYFFPTGFVVFDKQLPDGMWEFIAEHFDPWGFVTVVGVGATRDEAMDDGRRKRDEAIEGLRVAYEKERTIQITE